MSETAARIFAVLKPRKTGSDFKKLQSKRLFNFSQCCPTFFAVLPYFFRSAALLPL